ISVDGEKMGFPISGFCPRQPDPVSIYRRRSSSSSFIFGEDGEEFGELVSEVFSSFGSKYIPTFPTLTSSVRCHRCAGDEMRNGPPKFFPEIAEPQEAP